MKIFLDLNRAFDIIILLEPNEKKESIETIFISDNNMMIKTA